MHDLSETGEGHYRSRLQMFKRTVSSLGALQISPGSSELGRPQAPVRQLKLLDDAAKPRQLPNLERAAEFIQDLPSLWLHAGVTHEEREALVKRVFQRITIDGKDYVDIEPKPEYAPLFATMVTAQKVGYQESDSTKNPLGRRKPC